MSQRLAPWLALALALAAAPAGAEHEEDSSGFELTPPRLALVEGEVSFRREGAEDWTRARVNTALAAGDRLYTDDDANVELQVGPRAFVRADERSELGITGLEPDFLQLSVAAGTVSLDLRSFRNDQTIEVGTPNAAFTIERSGYYRVDVDGDTTTFTARRGGRAALTPAAGEPAVVAASEQVVVSGGDEPEIESYAAPELDGWDRWNYERTDDQLDAPSARYVSAGVYGAYDLDQYGSWRIVPAYGPIWVPRHVGYGWVPYGSGRWLWDPWYGWTWLDDAPWGWAPFHYGRWVFVSGYWAWCPGPFVVRPYYAPALVAFYGGGPSFVLTPRIGWVPLGWGEPLVPWWGPRHFRERAHWAGWGGPRIVNKVVVKNETVIYAKQIELRENAGVKGALSAVERAHFGRRGGQGGKIERLEASALVPLRGDVGAAPDPSSLVPDAKRARRPPRERAVVVTREPKLAVPAAGAEPDVAPRARVVKPSREASEATLPRAPFGQKGDSERRTPLPAPRYEDYAKPPVEREPRLRGYEPVHPQAPKAPSPKLGREPKGRVEPLPHEVPEPALPGEPANRVYRIDPSERVPHGNAPSLRGPKPGRGGVEPGAPNAPPGPGVEGLQRGPGR